MAAQKPGPIMTSAATNGTAIDRRKCKRVVPMRVLVLSMGRTGTTSLRIALKQLGYNDTYHMMSASIENPPDCLMWLDAFAAKYDGKGTFDRKDWDQLLGHCQAVSDWPACAFAKELIEAYPEAKVILTVRDVDSWHKSTMKTVYWRATDPWLRMLSYVDWNAGLYYPMLRKFFDTMFRGDFPNQGKTVFREHYAQVRELVPPENLLEYDIRDGWRTLCRFLDTPVPKEIAFPNVHDVDTFRTRSRRRNLKQTLHFLSRLLPAVTAMVMLVWWSKRLF